MLLRTMKKITSPDATPAHLENKHTTSVMNTAMNTEHVGKHRFDNLHIPAVDSMLVTKHKRHDSIRNLRSRK